MPTRAVHLSKVLTSAFMVFAMGLEAGRPSNIGSESTKQAPLKKVADIPMPRPAVRFHYHSLYPSQARLYIAHINPYKHVVVGSNKSELATHLGRIS